MSLHDEFNEFEGPGPIRPVYCTKCGKKLKRDDRHTGYDAYTGEPVFANYDKMICKNTGCFESPYYDHGGW